MSAPTFIRSFKRFSSRRGLPALMLSDNGKAFEAAAKVIKKAVASPEVQKYFNGLGIEWRFNVPKSPWWGGVFERLVRSTKRCLRKAVGQAKLSHDELLTALIEIEMVLNSRPLTYISPDHLEEPLTPSHLLVGRRLMYLPDRLLTASYEIDGDEEQPQLTARLKYLNRSLDAFWKRWRREYLKLTAITAAPESRKSPKETLSWFTQKTNFVVDGYSDGLNEQSLDVMARQEQ